MAGSRSLIAPGTPQFPAGKLPGPGRRRQSGWQARPRREDVRIADAPVSACADGLRHGGEDLEPRVKAGEAENRGHQGRRGSQTQATAQEADPAGDANQHGKPARIAEGHPGQIDDEPAGTRPQQAEELLTQHGCTRDVDFAADRHDGVTIFTADGKCRGGRDMIDFTRRHRRPPISVPAEPGCGVPKATLA